MPLALAACSSSGNEANIKQQQKEQNYTASQQKSIDAAEPFVQLKDSAARRIQNYYYTTEADPNKIWYLTLLALDGSPIAQYTIQGPVESQADQVTNPVQQQCGGHENDSCIAIGLAEPNGVFQSPTSNDHIAILTDGAQIRFENNYIVSDQPLKINQPVKLSIDETKAISPTNLSKSVNGVTPHAVSGK